MKEVMAKYLACLAGGGVAQIGVESHRILFPYPSDLLKFPNGFASMNFFEEFAEGSIPMLGGAIAGQWGYNCFRKVWNRPYNPNSETRSMILGGLVGYSTMAVTGAVLHNYLGVPDVKWGPFK